MATKSLLFVGAGAVGSYIGAFLSRAGHDVTYIDPWPEQVEAIRTRGISVTGPHDPFQAKAKALHIHEAQQLDAPFDIAFIAMKTYDTAWATHLALSHVKPEGFVVSAQNCWNDPVVAGIAGVGPVSGTRHVAHRRGAVEARRGRARHGARRGRRATTCSARENTTARSRRAPRSSRRC